ncbi:MAG: LolA family protein [Phycisphaerales bacterium]
MNTPNDNNLNDHDPRDPDQSPESIANDRFIHGLLGYIHHDSKATKETRIQRVLDNLDESHPRKHHPFKIAFKNWIPLASAAMIMMVAFTLFILSPQPTAYAIVNNAIEATRTSATLRYEIKAPSNKDDNQSADNDEDTHESIGTLDMRGNLSRVQLTTPHGHNFIMGTDAQGQWSLRRDGTVERHNPKGAAPRWINLGASTILIASLDEFLIQLKEEYSVEVVSDNSTSIIQLNATRLPRTKKSKPDQISVWIDPNSLLVDRLELRWNQRQGNRRNTPRRPRPEPGSKPGPDADRDTEATPERRPPNHRPPPPPHHDPLEAQWFPELLGPTPMFDEGHNPPPPPPPLIIFQRVEPIDLPDESFSPPST